MGKDLVKTFEAIDKYKKKQKEHLKWVWQVPSMASEEHLSVEERIKKAEEKRLKELKVELARLRAIVHVNRVKKKKRAFEAIENYEEKQRDLILWNCKMLYTGYPYEEKISREESNFRLRQTAKKELAVETARMKVRYLCHEKMPF